MRKAGFAFVGSVVVVTVLAACVGGPGPLPDQGPDQASQGGGIQSASGGSGQPSGSKSAGGGTATSTSQTIKASEFERSCTADSDCVTVYEGLVCGACQCPNAAIAKKDQVKYSSELAKRSAGCSDPGDVACDPCASPRVGCDPDTKRCAIGKSSGATGGG